MRAKQKDEEDLCFTWKTQHREPQCKVYNRKAKNRSKQLCNSKTALKRMICTLIGGKTSTQDATDQSPSWGNTHNISKAFKNDTLIHCFTPINPHPHIQKLAMSMSLSRSYSIMPVTVHRTGLTAEVKASLLNLTDLKSYNSPAALPHCYRNNVQQHDTICQIEPNQTKPEIDKTHKSVHDLCSKTYTKYM